MRRGVFRFANTGVMPPRCLKSFGAIIIRKADLECVAKDKRRTERVCAVRHGLGGREAGPEPVRPECDTKTFL